MRKLWKYYILCSVAVLCLLSSLFLGKNSSAITLTRGWGACNQDYNATFYTNDGNIVIPCGSISSLRTFSRTAPFIFNRLDFQLGPPGQGPWPQDLDEDAYGMLNFTLVYYNNSTGATFPTAFIGRNLSGGNVTVLEQEYQILNQNFTLEPSYPCVTTPTSGNCQNLVQTGYTYIMYSLKIRVHKTEDWNGQIALMTNMTVNDTNFIYTFGVSQARIGWYEDYSNAQAEANEQDEEDRNNIESQSSQTESDAENSKEDVEQGTSSLISTISNFSTMLAGIHTTNCKLPEISAYGFSLGRIDVCTFSPPSWISTIGNVIISLIAVRLAIAIFRRIMGIIKGVGE